MGHTALGGRRRAAGVRSSMETIARTRDGDGADSRDIIGGEARAPASALPSARERL